ncbi:LOW QUALITY PROTEIN: hypothetical protein HID58_029225, partial [Brassica napus]
VSPIPSSASQRRLRFSKSYFQALGVTGVGLEEFVAYSAAVNCLKIGRKPSRVLVTGGEDHKVNLWAICKPNAILVSSFFPSTASLDVISVVSLLLSVYLICFVARDSVTFDASEVLVAAGAASQNNEGETQVIILYVERNYILRLLDISHNSLLICMKIKGCGGMARKICFLRLNVKGWSSFKEFIDKEVYKDLADVEVKLGELEAELSESNVVNDKLQRSYNELVELVIFLLQPIDILEAPLLQEPTDPTKQVKLGFLNGLVPCNKSMVFQRILFRAP